MQKGIAFTLDKTDKQIIHALQNDSRITMKDLGAKINKSSTATFERIKQLEKSGVIEKYSITVNHKKMGLTLSSFVMVRLKEHFNEYIKLFESEITKFKEVSECYHMTGDFDYLLKITVEDMDAYHGFIKDKLAKLNNIGNVQSCFVMNTLKKG
ncbi:MAG: Lrp/AsnC family transcriptional regulator [Flavobacteriales bacterium]|jgi:Lrp/AsnC family leucine-responsive transcriptional regulator